MRVFITASAIWLASSLAGWAQPVDDPATETAPERRVERRVERREDRRENAAAAGRALLPEGAKIQAPGVNVQVPPAGSGAGPSVQAPGANVQVAPGNGAAATVRTQPALSGQEVATGAIQGESNGWRYRRYNGQWWYWLPSNRWVVWSGSNWMAYDPNNPSRYATGYRGVDEGLNGVPNNTTGNYGNGVDNGGSYYDRRGVMRPRPSYNTGGTSGAVPPQGAVRGSPIQGGGGGGTGGQLGTPEANDGIRAGGSVNSSQSSDTGARTNLGAFGQAGGQIGGSGGANRAPSGLGAGGQLNTNNQTPSNLAPPPAATPLGPIGGGPGGASGGSGGGGAGGGGPGGSGGK